MHHACVSLKTEYLGKRIVASLRRQLGWAHFKVLIPIQDSLTREFYIDELFAM